MYQLEIRNKEVQKELLELDERLYSSEHLQNIQNKAKEIFDLENLLESIMYYHLLRLSKIYLVAPYISELEYEGMRELISSIIKRDKWDILKKFNE